MKHSIFSVIGVVSVIMLPYTAFAVSSGGAILIGTGLTIAYLGA